MSIGLALIAKDEEGTLPNLLASIEGAFDQVALLDTGSTDGTVDVFKRWAHRQALSLGHKLGRFEWCDDFSAARNAAEALLETDWVAWADCDDEIAGAHRLREIAANGESDVQVLDFTYFIAIPGEQITGAVRERVSRRGLGRWAGRVHEGRAIPEWAERREVRPEFAHWTTKRSGFRGSSRERNARILRRWLAEEPGHPIALRLTAVQELGGGSIDRGLAALREYAVGAMSPRERKLSEFAVSQIAARTAKRQEIPAMFLCMALGCPPNWLTDGVHFLPGEEWPPASQDAPKSRQQRRAEARAEAKRLARAA